jgi:uncharacterized protein
MTEIKIEREDRGSKGRYVARVDGLEAELTFTVRDGRMSLDHAGVPPPLEGRGIASALVAHAVQEARDGGFELVPACPFATAQFKRHPEWSDVLAK